MKTDSHDPTEGREPTETEDNVVRLPREWLGPREELVQIGVADAAAVPPAPEDFWGEGSSELQSALVGTPGVPLRPSQDSSLLGSPRHASFAGPRWSRISGYHWLARTPAVIAAATAALILAVVLISAVGGASRSQHAHVASLLRRPGPSTDGSRSSSNVLRIDARRLSVKTTRVRRVHRPAHARPSKRRAPTPGTSTPPVVVANSSTSTPATTYSAASSVSSGSAQVVSNDATQAASAQPTQPAFGANGSLGPGHGASNTQ